MADLIGLNAHEAAAALRQYGLNQVKSTSRRSPWKLLLQQFESSLVLILIAACIFTATLGDWGEAIAIASILFLNALIGFYQDYRAETAIQALAEMTAPRARVVRDGYPVEIAATEVVPGDRLLLEAGDIIAGDGKIVEASRLSINEASLTGESLPVRKFAGGAVTAESIAERSGFAFMGTVVANGTAQVEVLATGMNTELGKIAYLIESAQDEKTPLQVQLAATGRILLLICLAIVGCVFVLGIVQHRPWVEMLIFAISLGVAAVPEGMPAIVTVALAIGVQRMARLNGLIRNLPAVETLGSVTVICTDKTGTLTTGLMRVREIWTTDKLHLLHAAASCCDATLGAHRDRDIGDPTEVAILLEARQNGIEKNLLEKENPRLRVEPFDSNRRRMSITRNDGKTYYKGAFESLLPLCREAPFNATTQTKLGEMSSRGLRVLAIAIGDGDQEVNLELLGLIGMADPPRPGIIEALAEARSAGILAVMITGDHPRTAAAVAHELGFIVEGEDPSGKIHARATPEDKLKIVREWKERGAIVAMTGDGVNDAPALREAHIGIAMGKTGTQVTRQSADLVLGDDNFATIVSAIREGRAVYANIRKAVLFLLSGNLGELLVVFGASLVGAPLPLLTPHLLWINLVTDALPGLALLADPVSNDIMKAKPRSTTENLLGSRQWVRIFSTGLIEALTIGSMFWIQLSQNGVEVARSLAFTTLVTSQLFRSLSARSEGSPFFWRVSFFSNPWLLAVIVITLAAQLSLHFISVTQQTFLLKPLCLSDLLWIVGFALIPLTLLEIGKLVSGGRGHD
jgi:Ca2+-transporting ATPase